MMTEMTTENLKAELRRLETGVRADLAKFLIDSLHEDDGWDAAADWEAELDRRLEAIRNGTAVGAPAKMVMERLRKKHS